MSNKLQMSHSDRVIEKINKEIKSSVKGLLTNIHRQTFKVGDKVNFSGNQYERQAQQDLERRKTRLD